MFLKNKNIIFKIRRSKVTDYAALTKKIVTEIEKVPIFSPKTILLFRVYRVKKIRVGRQQEPHIYFI